MAIRLELTFQLQNSPGALHRVCEILRVERVNMVALSVESAGRLRIIVDNPQRAISALETCNYAVQSQDVLFLKLSNSPESLEETMRLLTDADVNIDYIYAAGLGNRLNKAVVIGVENVARAASLVGF
mgnify:CR=1 FL=1|tara:strand:- start:215 stop:598 length:384 start_codon:yes stop_codon:yes gene_type:complete